MEQHLAQTGNGESMVGTVLFAIGLFIGAVAVVSLVKKKTNKAADTDISTPKEQWQPQQSETTGSTWPTTSPTANTEAPNPTDPPASGAAPEADKKDSDAATKQ